MSGKLYLYLAFLILGTSIMLPQKAYAYLDPGTGSYVFQVVIASLMGILFSIKMFWGNIKLFFVNLVSKREEIDENKIK
ncbi:MAG: hypothetical protein A2287_00775 [Candidatus Melainabacteria bacterium RIFOXYA12_FULL_32_12]|nr:MAG: hypothetical protein A2287_00775 [Candidatus Melainabacteria bacterium RIFOXYA12_FULL_32_12]